MTAARSESGASVETLGARSKKARRQVRFTISKDMGALWDWFQDVPPGGAAGEIEFLLRLGVQAAAGLHSASRQVAQAAASSSALFVATPPDRAASQRRTEAKLEAVPAAEGGEARGEQVAGWNFASAGSEAAAAACDTLSPYAHWPSARTYRAGGR